MLFFSWLWVIATAIACSIWAKDIAKLKAEKPEVPRKRSQTDVPTRSRPTSLDDALDELPSIKPELSKAKSDFLSRGTSGSRMDSFNETEEKEASRVPIVYLFTLFDSYSRLNLLQYSRDSWGFRNETYSLSRT